MLAVVSEVFADRMSSMLPEVSQGPSIPCPGLSQALAHCCSLGILFQCLGDTVSGIPRFPLQSLFTVVPIKWWDFKMSFFCAFLYFSTANNSALYLVENWTFFLSNFVILLEINGFHEDIV